MNRVTGLKTLLDSFKLYNEQKEKHLYNELMSSYPTEQGKLTIASIKKLQNLNIFLLSIHNFMDAALSILATSLDHTAKEMAIAELIHMQRVAEYAQLKTYLTVFYHVTTHCQEEEEIAEIMSYFEHAIFSCEGVTIGDLWAQHQEKEGNTYDF